jgi:hypothetical protein
MPEVANAELMVTAAAGHKRTSDVALGASAFPRTSDEATVDVRRR